MGLREAIRGCGFMVSGGEGDMGTESEWEACE